MDVTLNFIFRNHSCYNSYEVGQRLGLTILSKLDPTADDPSHTLDPDLLPTYTQYKAITANLPGMQSLEENTILTSSEFGLVSFGNGIPQL